MPFHLHPSKMLVVGDPLQLPAIVQSKRAMRFGLDESFHERLMNRLGCQEILLLDTQYRMKPPISFFPAQRFYSGMLRNGGNVVRPDYGAATTTLQDNRAYLFMQIEGAVESDKSSLNRKEAFVALDLLKEMRAKAEGRPWASVDSLRVISFYQAQVSLIRSLLKANGFESVSVGTVDSSQGCESDIVIVSFVRGHGTAGFLTDDRRINVAISRARHQLICIGNVDSMARLPGYHAETLRQLSSDASTRRVIM
jgi:senataxin